jgi:putative PIN family toxin of toxin-antitoxin system
VPVKVVIDTNIYLSAIFWKGKPRQVVDLGRERKIQIFTSFVIEYEIAEKLEMKFKLSEREVNLIMADFSTFTVPAVSKKKYQVVHDDPDDDKFIECAMACGADYIVTGDRHLLKLEEFSGIKIVKAAEFLSRAFSSPGK